MNALGKKLPIVVKPREAYKPVLSRAERAAYQAAHKIVGEDWFDQSLACPSARRVRAVDRIAGIIMDTLKIGGRENG